MTLFRVHKHFITPEAQHYRPKYVLGGSAGEVVRRLRQRRGGVVAAAVHLPLRVHQPEPTAPSPPHPALAAPPAAAFLTLYANGKSAVRVDAPGGRQMGPHFFSGNPSPR